MRRLAPLAWMPGSAQAGRRIELWGVFAVLLALMAQIGAGAVVPQAEPLGSAGGVLCHVSDNGDSRPEQAPHHPLGCLLCPLCAAVHAPALALAMPVLALAIPTRAVVLRGALPPPSTAPPVLRHPPSQPRAPPALS